MGRASKSKGKGAAKQSKHEGVIGVNGVGTGVSEKDLDFSAPQSEYSGTFRWAPGKKFLKLPTVSDDSFRGPSSVEFTRGWGPYLLSRVPSPGVIEKVKSDPSALDGLTYPVTAAFILKRLGYQLPAELVVVVLGAASRAEERVARETAYWGEIAVCLQCRVHVVMCGPEVSEDGSLPPPNAYTRVSLFRGTFTSYQARFRPSAADTVLITYNGGFGNFVESGRFDLLLSWHDDLHAIVSSQLPAFFTQANDYADLAGETALMVHILGASFVMLPTQNPFSAASHLSEPDKPQAWACANHSVYGIQGFDKKRMANSEVRTPEGKRTLCRAVLEAVKAGCDMAMLEQLAVELRQPSGTENLKSTISDTAHLLEGCQLTGASTVCNDVSEPGDPQPPSYRVESSTESWRVSISLPLLDSANGIVIELVSGALELCFSTAYAPLTVAVPAISEDDDVVARFDKGSQELLIARAG